MTENEEDIELLRTDPNRLIMKHQKMIHVVAKEGLRMGWFPPSEFQDVVQSVNLELLARIETIRKNYDGRALLRTYISRIALNYCTRYLARVPPVVQRPPELLDEVPVPDRFFDSVLLKEARDRFQTILRLFGPRLPKILLFLRIYYKYPITRGDVLSCYPQCQNHELEPLLNRFGGDYSSLEDKQVMAVFAPFVNKMESSSTSPEGYRRWIGYIIGEICELLNGATSGARFDRATFFLLFEDFSFRFGGK